ncbi:MAG: FAD-dependent oxidoreductase, partial [Acidobacteria bacterium]|nr:FAD-dependent oxidoreductase [Acidobacteriota bacterium]
MRVRVIGGGLAGSECSWQLAERGHQVELVEMRPRRSTEAHKTGNLAELVCSNSFRADAVHNAVGLLKEEMGLLGSLVIREGRQARVPAGGAFAVDRERFSAGMSAAIETHPDITVVREEATDLELHGADLLVVATGPLTSSPLHQEISSVLGHESLYFY